MEILGIGPLELFFILIIALIILGPGDMVKAGRTIGRFMRRIIMSSEWQTIQKASRELRYLPNKLMRDANLEDISKEFSDLNKIGGQVNSEIKKLETDLSPWTTPPGLTDPNTKISKSNDASINTSNSQNQPKDPNDPV
jgi:Sec-independent protein translocase protein TatA